MHSRFSFFSGVVLPSLVKPTVKVPSKLKECLRNTKAHFEGKLIEDQKLVNIYLCVVFCVVP